MIKRLKFMQINGQRTRLLMAQVRRVMDEEQIDILLLQEPYNFKGKVVGFADLRVISTAGDSCIAAIVVTNPDLTITNLNSLMNSHVACASIDWWVVYCIVYCQAGHQIQPYLGYLDNAMEKLEGRHTVIGMDANAKSVVWYSGYTDDKDSLMDEFVQQRRLMYVNIPSNLSTFSTVNGESNIDLTIVTPSCF